jgi:GAF domain-containing protein
LAVCWNNIPGILDSFIQYPFWERLIQQSYSGGRMDEKTWLQREANAVNVMYVITREINASLNLQEVLEVMLERIVVDLGYRAASLRLLDEEKHQLDLKAAHGLSETYLNKGVVDVTRSVVDRSVLEGKPVAIPDVRQDPSFQYSKEAGVEGLTGMAAIPLMIYNHAIGVLHVYTSHTHDFGQEELSFLSAIANIGAQAIQRTRLFGAFQRIAYQINSSLDLGDVLRTLLVESVQELNVKAGSVRLLGPTRQTLHLAAAYGLSETYLQKGMVKVAQSPIDQRVLQEATPVAITDMNQEGGFQYPEEARQEGIRSVFVVPMRVQDTLIGVLRLYSGQVRQYSMEEISFAVAVADLGAVAIENAKFHEALKQRLEALKEDVNGWYRFLAFG